MGKFKKPLIIVVLSIFLLQGCIFAVKRANEPPYEIRIGVPVYDAESNTVGWNFDRSEMVKTKHNINTILFSLIQARSAEPPQRSQAQADAVIHVHDPDEGRAWFFTVWIEEDSLLIYTETDYKVLNTTSYGYEDLKALLETHIRAYN